MAKRKHATRHPTWLQQIFVWLGQLQKALALWLSLPLRQVWTHIVILALAALTISLMVNFVHQVIQSANLEARRVELQAEAARMETENQQLRGAVEFAESDAYVERIAREQLGYAREGEVVIVPELLLPSPTPPHCRSRAVGCPGRGTPRTKLAALVECVST
ncbi:MAG: septum formation initiator family protein [Chloroflexaceae bacterium]|nr:septum formation initiator family protein [Chloroflexaceae bacterium]